MLLNFVFPPRCAGCEVLIPIESARQICAVCRDRIERIEAPICQRCGIPIEAASSHAICRDCIAHPPNFTVARAVARYRASMEQGESVLGSIIRRHKYGRNQALGRALVECLGESLPDPIGQYDIVVPVPLHPERLRWRGFNQAALLASVVARKVGSHLDLKTLVRTKSTVPQTDLDHDERRKNVRRAFAVRTAKSIAGRRILVVDDVMTTGSTVDECARVLLEPGAREVDAFALARAQ